MSSSVGHIKSDNNNITPAPMNKKKLTNKLRINFDSSVKKDGKSILEFNHFLTPFSTSLQVWEIWSASCKIITPKIVKLLNTAMAHQVQTRNTWGRILAWRFVRIIAISLSLRITMIIHTLDVSMMEKRRSMSELYWNFKMAF